MSEAQPERSTAAEWYSERPSRTEISPRPTSSRSTALPSRSRAPACTAASAIVSDSWPKPRRGYRYASDSLDSALRTARVSAERAVGAPALRRACSASICSPSMPHSLRAYGAYTCS